MIRCFTNLALFVLSVAVAELHAGGQSSVNELSVTKKARAVHATAPIELDGLLDEPDWNRALPIEDILQREPVEGLPPSERTEFRLLFDAENLYIGVRCHDSTPTAIVSTQMSRDADLSVDDRLEILIDTFRDRRNAFYFSTNPSGALVDGLIVENGSLNRDWDAIWDVRTRRTDDGWSAEFAIPFKSLSFKQLSGTWGFNLSRSIKRKIEEDRWAAARLDVRFFQVSEAGEIEGLSSVEQGRALDVRPYVSGSWAHSDAGRSTVSEADAGADIFYNITPSLKLTGTINTDFAETEVDNRQINLTRFPLFFPEKRAFFLENAGVFAFGTAGASNELIPFFSRRIGLVANTQVPILAGMKLTGKAGRYDLGLLDVKTRRAETVEDKKTVEAKNFLVARVKRNIWRQSYVGAIYTEGNPTDNRSSRTFGSDFRLGTSSFLGHRNATFNGYWLGVEEKDQTDGSASYGAAIAYPNDLWNAQLDWARIDKNFRPALGFVPRTDIQRLNVSVDFSPRPKNFLGIRQMTHEFRFNRFVRLSQGKVESWRVFMAPINYTWNSGDRFEVNWVPQFERLFAPFEISGVTLPPGGYRFDRYRLEFWTSNKRPWKIDTTWWFGTYWSGRADQWTGMFLYKLAPHVETSLRYDQTFARLKEGRFVARIFSFRANYSVTPFLTLYNLAQFDNDSQNLGWQSRVRWIVRPGREIFVVLNHGWIRENSAEGNRFRAADRGIAAKAQYTLRF
jgi:hypothetical protein